MNISAASTSNSTAAVKSASSGRGSPTNQATQQSTAAPDSFTQSDAASAALRKMKAGQSPGNAAESGQHTAAAKKVSQADNEVIKAAELAADSTKSETTTKETAKLLAKKSRSSKYSAVEVAKYDLNRNGKIDSSEEAIMRAAHSKESAKGASIDNSFKQMKSRDAYRMAMGQMQPEQASGSFQFSFEG